MTRDDIIRMAREAGWTSSAQDIYPPLERFAALVAAHERRRSERAEELLKKALDYAMDDWGLRLKIAAHFEEVSK